MTTAAPSTALATIQPVFTDAERLALAGFLAGYRSLTREAYALDLRQFTTWCRTRPLNLFAVRRADIESFARELEARGRARATVARRLCTLVGFYKYAVEEELIDHSPAAHVRRPRVDYESHAVALDRNELGALLVAAGLGPPPEHALISLLALNGLRVSEAAGADIEHLGLERGHRTLTITRKGSKVVTIPLAPGRTGPAAAPVRGACRRRGAVARLPRHWEAGGRTALTCSPGPGPFLPWMLTACGCWSGWASAARRSYAASYRQAQAGASERLPATVTARQRAGQLLRRHGQLVCRRKDPSCSICPISGDCPSAGRPPPLY